jgi:hypothetical protein
VHRPPRYAVRAGALDSARASSSALRSIYNTAYFYPARRAGGTLPLARSTLRAASQRKISAALQRAHERIFCELCAAKLQRWWCQAAAPGGCARPSDFASSPPLCQHWSRCVPCRCRRPTHPALPCPSRPNPPHLHCLAARGAHGTGCPRLNAPRLVFAPHAGHHKARRARSPQGSTRSRGGEPII